MNPLEVSNLSKIFSSRKWTLFGSKQEFKAVDNISFTLKKGETLGFLGPNGAGKTTTIQMLLGILNPSHGKINYFGKNFFKNRVESLRKVTFASSYIKLPSKLKVWENLDISGRLYNVSNPERSKRIEELLKFFDIWSLRDRLCGALSAGQITRVMLVKAFLPKPEIILLDEPTASLDPDIAQEVREFILKQKKEFGVSILFTSHNMDEVTQVCDRVLVLKSGKIVADDSPLALAATISKAHVHLIISTGIENAIQYAQKNNLSYKKICLPAPSTTLGRNSAEGEGWEFSFEINETDVGLTLVALANLGVVYTSVSIDKPNLEDYFLTVSKNK